jgi:hypothetical protein
VPDDVPDEGWTAEDSESAAPEVAHDDIMKRLLDYQRSLREGASPTEAAEAAWQPSAPPDEVSAQVEPSPEPEPERRAELEVEAPAPREPEPPAAAPGLVTILEPLPPVSDVTRADLEERLASVEERLSRLRSRLAELRQSFQDMAIDADERLAQIEEELGHVRRDHERRDG